MSDDKNDYWKREEIKEINRKKDEDKKREQAGWYEGMPRPEQPKVDDPPKTYSEPLTPSQIKQNDLAVKAIFALGLTFVGLYVFTNYTGVNKLVGIFSLLTGIVLCLRWWRAVLVFGIYAALACGALYFACNRFNEYAKSAKNNSNVDAIHQPKNDQ